jgi:tetratricopeptide (TPR) repeat protein
VVRKPNGGVELQTWTPAAKAAPHFEEAEKLFAARSFAAAGEAYEKGLALDPTYGPGWLYAGDIPFGRNDFPAALARYRKALELDPTLSQAHRFAGDALLRLGRLAEAEDEYVKAVVYDPSYDGALQGLETLGAAAGFTVARHEFLPPAGVLGEAAEGKVPLALSQENKQWFSYFLCKAVWRNEPAYRKKRLGKEGAYNWTSNEETECLASYLIGNLSATEAEIQKASPKANPNGQLAPVPQDQVLAAAPPLVRHLKEVADAGLLPGFALYAVVGRRCPVAITMLPDGAREDLERYIRRFVIIRAPAPPKP